MKILVQKSDIGGSIQAPPSKSYTIRALMCSALVNGQSEIFNPLYSDDTQAALRVLSQIGVSAESSSERWKIAGGQFKAPNRELFCSDSAATLRFMSAVCALVPGTCHLTAGISLNKRPIITLVEALKRWGIEISCRDNAPPVIVKGGTFPGGLTELPGDISSQYVSALLMIAPLAQNRSQVRLTTPLESRPYVMMTIECLKQFGIEIKHSDSYQTFEISPQEYKSIGYNVEADWSSASYLLGLGVVGGEIEISNLALNSLQADKALVDFLKMMGADIRITSKAITIRKKYLSALQADLNDCIDLLPTLAVLAALSQGTSEFRGIERARLKESNRIAALREGLEKTGIRVIEETDKMIITGGTPIPATINARNDHRIAMAFSLMGVACGDIIIDGAECVSKTYPEYWKTLRALGVNIDEQ
jgi:3-phosphoshikimate 1-carboxyvinyltransferase